MVIKYIGGYSDVVVGFVVIVDDDLVECLGFILNFIGGVFGF